MDQEVQAGAGTALTIQMVCATRPKAASQTAPRRQRALQEYKTRIMYTQLMRATEIKWQVTPQALHREKKRLHQRPQTQFSLKAPQPFWRSLTAHPQAHSLADGVCVVRWAYAGMVTQVCGPRSKASSCLPRHVAPQARTVSTKGADSLRTARLRRACGDESCFGAGLRG